jgi:hypothetical protein
LCFIVRGGMSRELDGKNGNLSVDVGRVGGGTGLGRLR